MQFLCKLLNLQSTDNRKRAANPAQQTTSLTRRSLFPCPTTRSGSSAWISTGCRVKNWAVWSTSFNRASPRCETPTQTRSRSTSKHSSLPRCVSSSDTSSPVYRKSSANLYVSALLFPSFRCVVSLGVLWEFSRQAPLFSLPGPSALKAEMGCAVSSFELGALTFFLQCVAWLLVDYLTCAFPGINTFKWSFKGLKSTRVYSREHLISDHQSFPILHSVRLIKRTVVQNKEYSGFITRSAQMMFTLMRLRFKTRKCCYGYAWCPHYSSMFDPRKWNNKGARKLIKELCIFTTHCITFIYLLKNH